MDTACLKIKFTPLLQEARRSSEKCCLEIIPEVSCIQNLDKLTWKQESNCIEYSIPMTYKIILRKRHIKNSNDEIIKTYHSCVDLLLSSSESNVLLGSGDVSKIISDTFILSKIRNSLSKENVVNITALDEKLAKIIQSNFLTDDTTDTILKITESTHKEVEEETENNDETNSDPRQLNELGEDKILCDKRTSTENIFTILTDDINTEKSINISKQLLSKPKLSLSPICSINTQEMEHFALKNTTSKGITCKIYDSQKDLVPLGCISNINDFGIESKISNMFQITSLTEQNPSKNFQLFNDRSPPEVRVAQYVHYMEKELLSLNVTLDELISKCTVLGLCKVPRKIMKSNSNNLIFYKSVCMCNNHITTETREKSISNRAVYSIVFDE